MWPATLNNGFIANEVPSSRHFLQELLVGIFRRWPFDEHFILCLIALESIKKKLQNFFEIFFF